MDALDPVQLKQLYNRLLCGHGGVGLAKSLLVMGLVRMNQDPMIHVEVVLCGVSVGSVRRWETPQKMFAARR